MNQIGADQQLLAEIVFNSKKLSLESRMRREEIVKDLIEHNIKTMQLVKDKEQMQNQEAMENYMQTSIMLMHSSLEALNEVASNLMDFLDVIVKKDQVLRKGN